MKLNHANLITTEVAALAGFFTSHFGFELVAMRGKEAFAVLRGTDGFILNLMMPGKGEAARYPDGFHVGFLVGKPDIVHAKQAELADAGLAPGEVQERRRQFDHLLLPCPRRNTGRSQFLASLKRKTPGEQARGP
jgi:catechol 2,3-dioxygenase-like lactoylglutathione lyase family enzyme